MKKILIAEDEAIQAMVLEDNLKRCGYKVLNPVDTGDAIMGSIHKERPDLIIIDLTLKAKEDGIEVAKRIKNHYPDMGIIFCTAKMKQQIPEEAYTYGQVIDKSEDISVFCKAINNLNI
jgi:CheY-like chemotaxis protein